jgi:hypothetical protein
MQFDAQLQSVVASLATASPNFAASDYFEALPSVGRFPFGSIDAVHLVQQFFPQQLPVQLSLIPVDELPAVIEDSMSLPPLDLTMPAASFANFSAYALVPVDRTVYNSQSGSLPPTPLGPALPQVAGVLPPLRPVVLLRPFITPLPATTQAPVGWQTVIGNMTYGFYVLRRSEPIYVDLTSPKVPATTTTPAPRTSASTRTAAPAALTSSHIPTAILDNLTKQALTEPVITSSPASSATRSSTTIPASITTPNPNIARILKAPATTAAPRRKTRPARADRRPRT